MHGRAARPRTSAARRRARLTAAALSACLVAGALPGTPVFARGKAQGPRPTPVSNTKSTGPALGDWEGTGVGGLPLSFELAHATGGVVARALAIGFPQGCPVGPTHTLAVPVAHPFLPAAPTAAPAALVISGLVGTQQVSLTGQLNAARSATLSIQTNNPKLPCPWPTTLTWQAHPAHRLAVPDASWSAPVTGPGMTGAAAVQTAAGGRVVTSFQAHYTCTDPKFSGTATVGSTPAFEFIAPDGRFASPANLQFNHKVAVRWSGVFGAHGSLHGSFVDASPCTGKAVRVSFAAAAPTTHR